MNYSMNFSDRIFKTKHIPGHVRGRKIYLTMAGVITKDLRCAISHHSHIIVIATFQHL